MPLQNTFYLDVDFKQKTFINEPVVTQNDEIKFVLRVFDDGQPYNLAGVTTFTLASVRPDKQSVMTQGTKTATEINEITFALGSTEISVPGRIESAIQLYDADGRVSTIPFTFKVLKDIINGYIPSVDDQTLIELVLGEGPEILVAAEQATIDANTAADSANASAQTANTSAINADTATTNANNAATNANDSATAADVSTINANNATNEAETATTNAVNATTDAIEATNAINLVLPNVEGLEYVEPYNPLTAYVKNNMVRFGKNSYIALQDTTGNEPTGTTDSIYWGVLAVGGVDGTGSVVTVNAVSPDASGNVALTAANIGAIPTSEKGNANGVATLNSSGKVPSTQIVMPVQTDASLTNTGPTRLSNTLGNDDTKAATPGLVNQVSDVVTTHLADYLKHTGYAVATGPANTYVSTLNPALSAYAEGVSLRLKINVANTGASTINVNGLGAKAIRKSNGNGVASGNLKAGSVYTLAYDGTSFILQGEGGEYGTAVAGDVLSGKTVGTDAGVINGTLPSKVGSATIITPSAVDQAITQGYYGGSLGDGKVKAISLSPGVNLQVPLRALVTGVNSVNAYSKVYEVQCNYYSVVRVTFNLRSSTASTVYAQIYINDVAVGIERIVTGTSYVGFTEDITLSANDKLAIYAKGPSSTPQIQNIQCLTAEMPFIVTLL